MSYSCCSGNISGSSQGYQQYPASTYGSSYPNNLGYNINLWSPSTNQLGSSLNSGCQENVWEPTRLQRSCVVSIPCQMSCYCQENRTTFGPYQMTYSGFQGFGSWPPLHG